MKEEKEGTSELPNHQESRSFRRKGLDWMSRNLRSGHHHASSKSQDLHSNRHRLKSQFSLKLTVYRRQVTWPLWASVSLHADKKGKTMQTVHIILFYRFRCTDVKHLAKCLATRRHSKKMSMPICGQWNNWLQFFTLPESIPLSWLHLGQSALSHPLLWA